MTVFPFDPATGSLTVRWNSEESASSVIDHSEELTCWNVLTDAIAAQGESTAVMFPNFPVRQQGFFGVRRL